MKTKYSYNNDIICTSDTSTLLSDNQALQKKLNDLKFLLDSLADDTQYLYGLDSPIYIKIKKAIQDTTKWSI
jgi:hypothetical protein